MTDALWNLAAYSLQLGSLAIVAVAAAAALRVRLPRAALRYWQAILAAALLLPFLQPAPGASSIPMFTASAGTATVVHTAREAFFDGVNGGAMTAAFIVLALGAMLRLLWLALGLWRVRWLVANAHADDVITPAMHELQQQLGTNATILISDDLEGPATVGVRRPVVLVPRSVLAMSEAVQLAIVSHELVHVRRRDWLHTIGEELWCAVLWFHPATRMIASRLSLAREMVVDETTLALTRDRRAYAEALLAFADPQPHIAGVTPFIGRRTLSQRIALIAEERPMSRRRAFVSIALALFASASLTAAVVDRLPMSSEAVQKATVYRPGNGVSLPVVLKEAKPGYTRAAMDAKIQGSVWLECVVTAEGDIGEVKVTRSLDEEYGLDQQAVNAAKQWKFKPGMKDGKPVAVAITLELTFTLK
ncbi:MAG TPA: M56 family metallopeptidase [Vicinamibacterales bacterium]|nr:M56 family metallopeptidase [Vicinamibacterales bacterium]